MKFEIGERVRYVGSQPGHENAVVTIVSTETTVSMHPHNIFTNYGIEGCSNWLYVCAEVYLEKIKEKEVNIKPEDIICHPLDKRVTGLIGKKVYGSDYLEDFERICEIEPFELLRVSRSSPYPFSTGTVRYKFIAEYIEPVKQYRPLNNEELRDLLGCKVIYKGGKYPPRKITKYYESIQHLGSLELSYDRTITPSQLLEYYTYLGGAVCGVEI